METHHLGSSDAAKAQLDSLGAARQKRSLSAYTKAYEIIVA
jgi:hypothetical protein